jgi:hypothetical protein
MKNLFISLLLVVLLNGCTGLNTAVNNPAVNVVTDTAFILVLQNNPQYKPVVTLALQNLKALLNENITYDQLIIEITKQFPDKYATIGTILIAYIATDKPVSTTYLNLLDSYKAGIITKLNRFLSLTEA